MSHPAVYGIGDSREVLRCSTPVRYYTPVRYTPMGCTPVRYTSVRCMPVRCTLVRYTL